MVRDVVRDDVAEAVDALGLGERRRDGVVEAREARGVDVVDARQAHLSERLARGLLDGCQHATLPRGDEADRVARPARTARAADAVHVRLGVDRQVEVHDVADALDVEAARGDVGGHQDVELAGLQLVDCALALRLGHVAVDRGGRVAAGAELLGEGLGLVLGAGEDDHALEGLDLEDAGQGIHLLRVRHDEVALRDVRGRRGLRLDVDLVGVFQVRAREAADLGRHRRREERDLLAGGGVGEDRLDVFGEAHLEHLVGLVEHEEAQLRQVERALVEVVHDATGGADDHVHAAAERRQLLPVALSAVDGQHVHTAQVRRVRLERLAHLQGELARGSEHERLRRLLRQVELREDRQRERGRLAGAGLRRAEHVAPGQQRRNRRGLDRRRGLVAHVAHRLQHGVVEAEIGEGEGGGRRGLVGRTVGGHPPTVVARTCAIPARAPAACPRVVV